MGGTGTGASARRAVPGLDRKAEGARGVDLRMEAGQDASRPSAGGYGGLIPSRAIAITTRRMSTTLKNRPR